MSKRATTTPCHIQPSHPVTYNHFRLRGSNSCRSGAKRVHCPLQYLDTLLPPPLHPQYFNYTFIDDKNPQYGSLSINIVESSSRDRPLCRYIGLYMQHKSNIDRCCVTLISFPPHGSNAGWNTFVILILSIWLSAVFEPTDWNVFCCYSDVCWLFSLKSESMEDLNSIILNNS